MILREPVRGLLSRHANDRNNGCRSFPASLGFSSLLRWLQLHARRSLGLLAWLGLLACCSAPAQLVRDLSVIRGQLRSVRWRTILVAQTLFRFTSVLRQSEGADEGAVMMMMANERVDLHVQSLKALKLDLHLGVEARCRIEERDTVAHMSTDLRYLLIVGNIRSHWNCHVRTGR